MGVLPGTQGGSIDQLAGAESSAALCSHFSLFVTFDVQQFSSVPCLLLACLGSGWSYDARMCVLAVKVALKDSARQVPRLELML